MIITLHSTITTFQATISMDKKEILSDNDESNSSECIGDKSKVSVEEQLNKISQMLSNIQHQNKYLQHMVNRLSEEVMSLKREGGSTPVCDSTELPTFPLNSQEDFFDFESVLEDSQEAREQLKLTFLRTSGHDVKDFLRRNLRYAIKDELIQTFTWTGKSHSASNSYGDKPRARSTNFMRILKDACCVVFPETNHTIMDQTLQQYFLHAGDRVRARSKKLKGSSYKMSK